MTLNLVDWLAIGVYFVSLLAIGLHFAKGQNSLDEYFLGRRRFGAFVMSISVLGTATSAISFLGVPGFVVAQDWSIIASSLVMAPAALLVASLFVPVFYGLRLTSVYEYLERRFDRRVAVLNSALFLLMRGTLAGVAIFAPSLALSVVTGWDLTLCIVLSAALTIIYTTVGGMSAVVWTELLQVIILFGGALYIVGYFGVVLDGGPIEWYERASAANKFNVLDFRFSATEITFWSSALGGMVFNVAFYGIDQVLVQRYLAASSAKAARRSLALNALYAIPVILVLFLMGTLLYLFIQDHSGRFPDNLQTDQYLPYFIVNFLPRGLPGLMIAAIYAAAMSTLSSVLNSLTTITITDFIRPGSSRPISDAAQMRLARWITVAWGVVAIGTALLAGHLDSKVTLAAVKGASLFMGGMLGVYLLGLYSRRLGAGGAYRACLFGVVASFVFGFWTPLNVFWLATAGTLLTIGWGWAESMIHPLSAEAQAKVEMFTLRGFRRRDRENHAVHPLR